MLWAIILQSCSKPFDSFLMYYQTFLSPQVKRSVIISNKNGIYNLPSDLILRILGNQGISDKSKFHTIIAQGSVIPPQNENFVNTLKTRAHLKYSARDCSI